MMNQSAQQSAQVNPWLAAGGGAIAGGAAVQAATEWRSVKKTAVGGLVTGGLSIVNQLLIGQQMGTLQNTAGQVATASQALAFTAGGATGAEVGALRAQVVALANNQQTMAYNLQMSNLYGLNTAPAQPVPATSATAGTAATQVASSNNSGVLAILALAAVGYVAFKD